MNDDIDYERLLDLLADVEVVWVPSEFEGYEQAALPLEEEE